MSEEVKLSFDVWCRNSNNNNDSVEVTQLACKTCYKWHWMIKRNIDSGYPVDICRCYCHRDSSASVSMKEFYPKEHCTDHW